MGCFKGAQGPLLFYLVLNLISLFLYTYSTCLEVTPTKAQKCYIGSKHIHDKTKPVFLPERNNQSSGVFPRNDFLRPNEHLRWRARYPHKPSSKTQAGAFLSQKKGPSWTPFVYLVSANIGWYSNSCPSWLGSMPNNLEEIKQATSAQLDKTKPANIIGTIDTRSPPYFICWKTLYGVRGC